MRALLLSIVVLAAPSALAAKIAVFAPSAGAGLTAKEALVLADAVAAAASRAGHDVVTQQQIEALVGLEAAKQMAGCSDGGCAAEIGPALGVDAVVSVAVGKLGKSLVLTLKRTDVVGGTGKVADVRIQKQKGAVDAALDALPALVSEVLAALPTTAAITPPPPAPTTTTTTPPTTTPAVGPVARRAVPVAGPKDLLFVDDGAGHLIGFGLHGGSSRPLFAGTEKDGLYAQRIIGSGSNGASFSMTFWDPRFRDGWQRSFEQKDGAFHLVCGDKTVAFSPVSPERTAVLRKARFFQPAWQRQGVLVGRDDKLRYVVVDDARDNDGGADLHVFAGKKGKMVALDAELERDPSFGDGGVIAVGEGFTIKLGPKGGEWIEGASTTKLTALDLFDAAALLYKELKPWGDVALGTPCDGR